MFIMNFNQPLATAVLRRVFFKTFETAFVREQREYVPASPVTSQRL